MSKLERVSPPQSGSLPHDHYIAVLHSIAISLKRIGDTLERQEKANRRRPRSAIMKGEGK
ncbi:hypothetical protein [Sphingomonas trueperi]|uniref:Uncharacterized protein n=1 Tax=Sphingomonas trueperi TaxID=53317 RepID=A0A7X5Y2M7_9SPHN|nr:hypothetical protein [Sphingomonas trueperi]NJB99899.1 hypothetical protein [Sphingomonas trueperi]